MTVALELIVVLSLLELFMYLPFVWQARRLVATVLLLILAAVSGFMLAASASLFGWLFFVVTSYRLFNLLRLSLGQRSSAYLRSKAFTTSWSLIFVQIILACAAWGIDQVNPSVIHFVIFCACLQFILALGLLTITLRHLRRMIAPSVANNFSDRELPSISVCVPARNETESLNKCLQSLIASDYPKLEILVLDDCSQDKTAEIIKEYAHDGVRFVAGSEPSNNWLAKNWAYQQLYAAASGKYLVFSGVDIIWESGSLRALVATMLHKNKQMVCVVPRNHLTGGVQEYFNVLLQPLRYAWEACLPRRLFKRPPVLSSCWIIERELVRKVGAFSASRNSISPEAQLAKAAARADGYSFVRSDNNLAVSSQKAWQDQWDTATRTRYPQLRRRPELVLLLTCIQTLGLLAPLVLVIAGIIDRAWLVVALSSATSLVLLFVFILSILLTYRRFLWRSLYLAPFAILTGIAAQHYSMSRYEFSEVLWKGRNVCLPVMEVIPHLPKL